MDDWGETPADQRGGADGEECDQIARTLAQASPPDTLDETSRTLVVEPRSRQIARSLRAVGFQGPLVALASVPIGERFGIAGDYQRVIVDDWAGRIWSQSHPPVFRGGLAGAPPGDSLAGVMALGQFDRVVVTDLTRYLPAPQAAKALRWLAGFVAAGGWMVVVDPALTPARLEAALGATRLSLAATEDALAGDWPRTLTLWLREPAPSLEGGDYPDYPGGSDPRNAPLISPAPFRRERMLARAGDLQVTFRHGSRLSVIAARDGALLPDERAAIARYRLEQYLHVHLFERAAVERLGLREDPTMSLVTPDSVHFLTVTEDGVIAAYLCLMNASRLLTTRVASEAAAAPDEPVGAHEMDAIDGALPLGETDRPIFAVETKHPDLYAQHPAFRTLPVANVREISRLVRNQQPELRDHLRDVGDIAIGETIVASALYVINPENHVELIIGNMAVEARRALLAYRIPVAYSPDAPQQGENLNGCDDDGNVLWSAAAQEQGFFWPFAISVLDVRAIAPYFTSLVDALNQPSPRDIRAAVNDLRRRMPLRPSRLSASFTYAGYAEEGQRPGFTRIELPNAWVDLEARGRPV